MKNTRKCLQRRLERLFQLFLYLCNDVAILSMHLCNSAEISYNTEYLIDLKKKDIYR